MAIEQLETNSFDPSNGAEGKFGVVEATEPKEESFTRHDVVETVGSDALSLAGDVQTYHIPALRNFETPHNSSDAQALAVGETTDRVFHDF